MGKGASSYQYPTACKYTLNSIVWREYEKLIPIHFLKSGCLSSVRFSSYGKLHHMGNALVFP